MTASSPVLAADVGNSRVKYGWFLPEPSPMGEWPGCQQFLSTTLVAPVPTEQLCDWCRGHSPRLILAGSNPQVMDRIAAEWNRDGGRTSWVLRDRGCLPLTTRVDHPDQVGLDRLLNAVAANALRPADHAAIVIDSGTATTVDLITAQGEFAGGAILPGLALSAQALHHYTALLPLLTLADLGPELPSALGTNTREALRSGIYWGQVGAIRQLVDALSAGQSGGPPWLVLTGGGATWLGAQFPGVLQVPSLAMHGLVLTAWSQ